MPAHARAIATLLLAAAPVLAQTINEDLKILPANGAAGDFFGDSVAIDGGTAIAGSPRADDNGFSSGSAYLFDTATGQEMHKLLPPDGAANDQFGWSVAISGNRAVVGAIGDDDNGGSSGSAYVFDVTTGQQLLKLLPNNGSQFRSFGWSVAISGNIAIVGAPGAGDSGSAGSAYLFDVTNGQQLAEFLPIGGDSGDAFGGSVAISGTLAAVTAASADENGSSSGAAYLFSTTTGQQIHTLLPSDGAAGDQFGNSVAISGNTILVGLANRGGGSAYMFDAISGQQIAKLIPDDIASDDRFGFSVAISNDLAVVGARLRDDSGTNSGTAYLFNTNTHQQISKLISSDSVAEDRFGDSVGISGNIIVCGAYLDDDNGTDSGSAYLFNIVTQPCPGDINDDDTVDLADFNVLGINFGIGPGATREQGDLNDDGFVNLADFNILGINFGNSCL